VAHRRGAKGNPGVAGLVKNIPGAIGYMEHAYALQNHLPSVWLRNRSGKYAAPSLAGVTASVQACLPALKADNRTPIVNAAGPAVYPICGLTYAIAYQRQADKTKGATLVKLLNWCMSTGQKSAPALQYAPLPASLVTLNKGLIGRIK
jgi:phosphate transport system substrate-binding protein